MPNNIIDIRRMKGDRLTPISATLMQNGSPVNLTGKTVTFRMIGADNEEKIASGSVTVVSAAAGTVYYDLSAGDVDTAGVFYGWFIVTAGGKSDHFPHDGRKYRITILEENET